jgi:hypothetical protein
VLVLLMGGMKGAAEMASCDMIYKTIFRKIGSGIQVLLSSLPQQYERTQCWYY